MTHRQIIEEINEIYRTLTIGVTSGTNDRNPVAVGERNLVVVGFMLGALRTQLEADRDRADRDIS